MNARRHEGPRVAIVGAGVVGASIAHALAKRGASPIVFDAGEPAMGCSQGNSGLLSPGHAPLGAPGVDQTYAAARDDPSAPGRVAPENDDELDRWMRLFSQSCTPSAYAAGMDALCALAPLVMPLFREWTAELPIRCDFRESGAVGVARSAEAMEGLQAYAEHLRARGLPVEIVSAGRLREIEPGVTDDAIGGVHFPDWATIEPYRFAAGVMLKAIQRGADLRRSTRVERIEPGAVTLEGGERVEADAVIVATGAEARELIDPLGVDLPMASAVGWHADLRVDGSPPVQGGVVIADRDVILTPMENRLRVSGLVEITTRPPTGVDEHRIEQLLRGPAGIVNGVEGEVVSRWVGRRPALPDGLPAIGELPGAEGVYLAAGHARMGLTLGPATGALLSQMILGEEPSVPLHAFDPGRFATQRA